MAIIPIRSDNAYFGFAKQSGQGVSTAPAFFPRWLDGSQLEFDLKTEEIWEGDGSRHLSLVIKNQQSCKIKLSVYPRPIELGFFEAMAMGAGSDTVTPPVTGTGINTSGVQNQGATTLVLSANTGLTGTGSANLMIQPGSLNKEEVVTVTTPGTGTGPYTYTITAPSTGLKFQHNGGVTVQSAATHTFVDGSDGNFYSIEVCLGQLAGSSGATLRVVDCKLDQIKRSSKAGKLVQFDIDFTGIATTQQGGPATVVLELHQPFLFIQSNGGWNLDNSTVGDALAIEGFEVTQKNALDTGVQTEAITLASIIFGNMMVDAALDLIFQNPNLFDLVYFNGGTTDSAILGYGNASITFTQADNFHIYTINIPQMAWTKDDLPKPKKDGKHYVQKVSGTGTTNSGQSAFVIQTSITNSQNSSY